MYIALMISSFILSTMAACFIYKMKKTKLISIILALAINTLILGVSFYFMYVLNIEMWKAGMWDMGLLYLLIAIPIITWLNAFLLQFVNVEDNMN